MGSWLKRHQPGDAKLSKVEQRQFRAKMQGRVHSHPAAMRLLKNFRKYGRAGAEIYTQYDDGEGNTRYFDVLSTRLWCDKRKKIEPLEINERTVQYLLENGGVNPEHILNKRFDANVAPVIYLREASIGGGLLIDGAHRYVAFAQYARIQGIRVSVVPAYILKPSEWKTFVVPPDIAEFFRLGKGIK